MQHSHDGRGPDQDGVSISRRLIGSSEPMRDLRRRIREVAAFDEPALVVGETGTGKELVARCLHEESPRGRRPLQVIHCAGLGAEVLSAELFGHVAGSFTGATRDRAGRLRAAHGSTVVLDELTETSEAFQAALLRVVEYGEIQAVGADRPSTVDVRFVATSNRPLEELAGGECLRPDLYHRLAAFVLTVPPLHRRRQDIPELAAHFLGELEGRYGRSRSLTDGALTLLAQQRLPGNVRQLRQILLRAYAATPDDRIDAEDVAAVLAPAAVDQADDEAAAGGATSLERVVRRHIRRTLRAAEGNLSQAARLLEIPRSTLQHYLVKYRVEPERPSSSRRSANS